MFFLQHNLDALALYLVFDHNELSKGTFTQQRSTKYGKLFPLCFSRTDGNAVKTIPVHRDPRKLLKM